MRPDRPLALTQGDPAGIGPDISLAAWLRRDETGLPGFVLIGDPAVIAARAAVLGLDVAIAETDAQGALSLFEHALPILPVAAGAVVSPGIAQVATAGGVIAAIETAVTLSLAGETGAVVTNPIAKSVLYQAGFGFPGHTEFLASLAERATGATILPVMMLAGPELRTVPVTIHIPLEKVPSALSRELIVSTCRVIHRDLKARFGLASPRLALSGLNPHAGENGALGREEIETIAPAITELRGEGVDAFGPLPADTMFHAEARSGYDVAVCMYHDQALIPAKALAFDTAVNVTLGLPFIRTSPDHGTAFAIAGRGIARETSLVEAIRLAGRLAARSERQGQ